MKIEKFSCLQGAERARGTAVIIDVFRAFSVACYCYHQGASNVIPAGEVSQAIEIAQKIDNAVLVGEREGKKLAGFDLGNSPTEVLQYDLTGKTVIQTTHAGTQGVVKAVQATEIITGALVNAKAIASYLSAGNHEQVSLVSMGLAGQTASDEDELCAEYLHSLLLGEEFAEEQIIASLKKSPFSRRFFDPLMDWSPRSDFYHCLHLNCFDFILRGTRHESGYPCLERVHVGR